MPLRKPLTHIRGSNGRRNKDLALCHTYSVYLYISETKQTLENTIMELKRDKKNLEGKL